MISDIQGIRFRENKFTDSCWKIVAHVAKNMESLSEPILDSLIEWFGESSQFAIAIERAEKMLNEFDYSSNQVVTIRKYIRENDQIHRPKTLREHIFKFMDRYPRHFNKKFRDWYDSRDASRMFLRN